MKWLRITILYCLLLLLAKSVRTQDSKKIDKNGKAAIIEKMLQEKNFVFVAQSAHPMSGRTIQLTSLYDVGVSTEKVVADLPFFGRAFSAPINPQDAGIRFTSDNYSYEVTPRKNKGWYVDIKPAGAKDVQLLSIFVSRSGQSTLQVTSTNRQPISFNGYIQKAEQPSN